MSFSGSGSVEAPTGPQVWAQLVGDLTELKAVAQTVQSTAKASGIMVDRRLFHPWLELQDIVGPLSGPEQERLLSALDRFVGQPWTIDRRLVDDALHEPGEPHGPPARAPALGHSRQVLSRRAIGCRP